MITFNKNIALNIVFEFDETTDEITDQEICQFVAGEELDATVIAEDGGFADIEFARGVAFGVEKSDFSIIR